MLEHSDTSVMLKLQFGELESSRLDEIADMLNQGTEFSVHEAGQQLKQNILGHMTHKE